MAMLEDKLHQSQTHYTGTSESALLPKMHTAPLMMRRITPFGLTPNLSDMLGSIILII